LIHLDELDCLDLLADFKRVLIPRRVWEEVVRHRASLDLSRVPSGTIVDPSLDASPQLQSLVTALDLGVGERDAIATMRQQQGQLLLCDDAAARLAAESLGLPVRGTIGLIVRSIRQGRRQRPEVIALLTDLPRRSTLYVSQSLLRSVIEDVTRAE
jgi:predicted nucleic acid-binding protein